ncbi:DNA cytosine methyltransferase [Roseospira visakhapatnamensis]|uniref:DNA cytosine methyltransferase n=1 Tax=Roseospira visakhapatnamensis TaxID=390880 RepID=UPI003CCE3AC4
MAEPEYRTVCSVERDPYAARVLQHRQRDGALSPGPIWDDIATFDGRPWAGRITILSAGYPCQPFSWCGQRRGTSDPRHLWPHVARIIGETRAPRVFLENVAGHLSLGFDLVAGDLRRLGYRVAAGLHSALEAGASHERTRLFILAHADGLHERQLAGGDRGRRASRLPQSTRRIQDAEPAAGGPGLDGDATPAGGPGDRSQTDALPLFAPHPSDLAAWDDVLRRDPRLEPALRRMGDGMADRLDRLRAVGNGVCPLAAALAY